LIRQILITFRNSLEILSMYSVSGAFNVYSCYSLNLKCPPKAHVFEDFSEEKVVKPLGGGS
jgi:hypothetical protein